MNRQSSNPDYARFRADAARAYGDSNADIARGLCVTLQVLQDWSCGRTPIPDMARKLVAAVLTKSRDTA